MPTDRQQFGAQAEKLTEQYLLNKGWMIIDRHVTSRYGEIDLIAKQGDTIVAVEVRAKRTPSFGAAIESLTDKKILSVQKAFLEYLHQHHLDEVSFRIDAIVLDRDAQGKMHIEHVQGLEEVEEEE